MSLEKRMNDLIMKYKVRPDALLDQSFMIDERMIKRIVSKACIKPGETVLEIGAGIGFLSIELVRTGGKVTSVELDERLRPILKEELKGTGIKIVCGNALEYIKGKGFDKIVSNTPYSICEPLVQRLTKTKFKEAFLSVPKRFA
ncbi:MAG: methyltransferase, partial [Nanoarchaeota archaeon]|nr:methyltransferase [Nanoarchaeota archaeon]